MKYFISEEGDVYAYESDGSQDSFIRPWLRPLTDEELSAIRQQEANDKAPTAEQLLSMAAQQRDRLLSLASLRIAPLQDAVDLDEATAADILSLKQWKQYRVAVNRVSSQPGYPVDVAWPEQPS